MVVENSCSEIIMLFADIRVMLPAVGFDTQFQLWGIEIQDVRVNRKLSSEFRS